MSLLFDCGDNANTVVAGSLMGEGSGMVLDTPDIECSENGTDGRRNWVEPQERGSTRSLHGAGTPEALKTERGFKYTPTRRRGELVCGELDC